MMRSGFWAYFLVLIIIKLACNDCNCKGLKLVARLPKNPLMRYTSYAHVMILHFKVPKDLAKAVFLFKVKETPTSFLQFNCDPRNISVYLKPGTYPVINPDGVPFPKTFLNASRPELYNLTMLSNMQPSYINITAPTPGNWFAAAFISYTDPRDSKITQQGLTTECEANIYAEFYTVGNQIQTLPNLNNYTITLKEKPQIYKFFVPDNIDHINVAFNVPTSCIYCKNIIATVQESRVPSKDHYLEKIQLQENFESNVMQIWPYENRWHYMELRYNISENITKDFSTNISISFKFITAIDSTIIKNETIRDLYFKTSVSKKFTSKYRSLQSIVPYWQYDMMRISSAVNFLFDYDLPPFKNGSSPLTLNVTFNEMTVLKFQIYDVIDIGGTLSLGFAVKPNIDSKKTELSNVTIIGCITKDVKEVPLITKECIYNNITVPAPVILNVTESGTLHIVHVPFPDSGTWYVTLRAFYDECSTCKCDNTCEKTYKICLLDCENTCIDNCDTCIDKCKTKTLISEQCHSCNCDENCIKKIDKQVPKNISTVFSISSHPCIAGRCGKYGKCNHYITGSFIFSACHCFSGYRGWDCSDATLAHSSAEILLAIFLLTLSNLFFISSIYFGYKRTYYTEAIVYFFAMVFSTFYHACDSEEAIYGFCIFKLGVLQFCDFFCGLLSIWVTLIAMAHFDMKITSMCHITGAIIIAFGTIYNKLSLWVFLIPSLIGLGLIGISWGRRCYSTRKLFPAKKYLTHYMPIGLCLVLMGLLSFAFLQTKDNYKFVHSVWHVAMAVSIAFLLPPSKNFIPNS